MVKNIVKKILFLFQIIKVTFGCDTFPINTINYSLIAGPNFEKALYMSTAIITDNDTLAVLVSQQNLTGLNCKMLNITRARILGKMDYFYFLRHMYETCL
jgi:hypothetical protein